jgi:PleD family two-component response regulator
MGGHRTREATQAKKILIAGGAEMMQLRLAQLMSGNKYRFLFAGSGKDAAAKTIGQDPNQVIAVFGVWFSQAGAQNLSV